MYFKLALRNVKKSFRDFLIYFLTLSFSVCLFYVFNSFQEQQYVMQLTAAQADIVESLSRIMSSLSIFVALVLAFLILYANNFLIKRRKKELGIYTLLGMPKYQISRILVYETFLIGLLSLLSGLIIGFFMSQLLTVITAHLFEVPLNYSFVFSLKAMIMTIFSFTLIFAVIMIFNSFILNRYQLIDLLNADKKHEQLKIKNVWASVIIFIISLACIGWAYYEGIHKGLLAIDMLGPIILAGSVGTVLFFLSLAGFMLTILQNSKNLYFKNLHCFIVRQIHASINSNFLSMSVVCIMLLLSIGALSCGINMSSILNKAVKFSSPYDYTYTNHLHYYNYDEKTFDLYKKSPLDIQKEFDALHINPDYLESTNVARTYVDQSLPTSNPVFIDHIKQQDIKDYFQNRIGFATIISLHDYNTARQAYGMEPITLQEHEAYLYSNYEMVMDGVKEIASQHPEITVFNQKVKIINDDFERVSLYTTVDNGSMEFMTLVIPDDMIPSNAIIYDEYWNANLTDQITPAEFSEYFKELIKEKYELSDKVYYRFPQNFYMKDKDDVYQSSKGLSVTFTYIGIYLGIVFMIASAVILALQQLSNADENKKRYLILSKIGTDQKMINKTIFLEIAVYFILPLLLAIVHSIVGIQIVNNLMVMLGKGNIFVSALFTAGIIVLVYGSYFCVTYIGYKNILKS